MFPPPAKETEGREGWQFSRRPPGPSGSPAPSPLPPCLCPASLCLRAVTSTPARMALGFTQRHFLGDSHPQHSALHPQRSPQWLTKCPGALAGVPAPGARWRKGNHVGQRACHQEARWAGSSVSTPRAADASTRTNPPHPRMAPGAASRSYPRPGCGIISPAFRPTFQPHLGPRGTARCTPPGPGHRVASQAPRPLPYPFCPSGWAAAPRALSGLPMLRLIPRGLSARRCFWSCSYLWPSLWTPNAQNRTCPLPRSTSPLIMPPSAYTSPQLPSTSLLSVCDAHQGLFAQPRGCCSLGVSLGPAG